MLAGKHETDLSGNVAASFDIVKCRFLFCCQIIYHSLNVSCTVIASPDTRRCCISSHMRCGHSKIPLPAVGSRSSQPFRVRASLSHLNRGHIRTVSEIEVAMRQVSNLIGIQNSQALRPSFELVLKASSKPRWTIDGQRSVRSVAWTGCSYDGLEQYLNLGPRSSWIY